MQHFDVIQIKQCINGKSVVQGMSVARMHSASAACYSVKSYAHYVILNNIVLNI